MKRLFLLEDDLSLVNGLSFAFARQGYALARRIRHMSITETINEL